MKVIDQLKEKVALQLIEKHLKYKETEPMSFEDFFKKSFTFLVMMPDEDHDFNHSFAVLRFLESNKKHISVFTYDYRVNLLPPAFRYRKVDFNHEEKTKFNIPSKKLITKLNELDFNAVVDLNRTDNLFYSYSANLVRAPLRIGFDKPNADRFYNIQVVNNSNDPEISYKNLLNCLQMF